MRITMLHQISGTRDGQEWPEPGTTIDLPGAEATQLLRAGQAVEDQTPVVDLTKPTVDTPRHAAPAPPSPEPTVDTPQQSSPSPSGPEPTVDTPASAPTEVPPAAPATSKPRKATANKQA